MLKVAIVGCGKISEAHASAIQRIKGARIVGVCDREELMAKQLFERFHIESYYSDFDRLLKETKPNVVHITTPGQSHYEIAKRCLQKGCHVYVEKPFTMNTEEAIDLISIAEVKGLKLTAGHDDQFSHCARRMRRLISEGYLGGLPIHMESHYCYEMSGSYALALLEDKQHWVRKLPGQLLHNIISHGIARIAEYLDGDNFKVFGYGFTSPFLKNLGEKEIVDELRVIISMESGITAYFTFSSQIRPALHQFRVYGSKNGIIMDQDNQTLVRLRGRRYLSYGEKFIPSAIFAGQYLENFFYNLRLFIGKDFHMKSGMMFLINSFYRAIKYNEPLPIPYKEIVLTTKIMEAIFKHLRSKN